MMHNQVATNILQTPAGLASETFLRKALVVDKAPLSSLAFKIHIWVPSP